MLPVIYISEKEDTDVKKYIKLLIKKNNIPSYLAYSYLVKSPSLTIEDIRNIKNILLSNKYKNGLIHVPQFHLATLESQHAFLKILEEGGKDTHIILSAKHISNIISTILSRVIVIYSPKKIIKKKIKSETINLTSTKNQVLEAIKDGIIENRKKYLLNTHKSIQTVKNLLHKYENISYYNVNSLFEYFG